MNRTSSGKQIFISKLRQGCKLNYIYSGNLQHCCGDANCRRLPWFALPWFASVKYKPQQSKPQCSIHYLTAVVCTAVVCSAIRSKLWRQCKLQQPQIAVVSIQIYAPPLACLILFSVIVLDKGLYSDLEFSC